MESAPEPFTAALCDDLNGARAMAAINEGIGDGAAGECPARELLALRRMDSVLGVLGRNQAIRSAGATQDPLEVRVAALLEARTAARASRNFAESDRIRDELLGMGVTIKDGPGGTTWSRVVK